MQRNKKLSTLHIQHGTMKASAAERPLCSLTPLIQQIKNILTIHINSTTIEM